MMNREMTAIPRRAFWLAAIIATSRAEAQREPLAEKLPDGRSRDLELAKRDHEKALEDVARIRRLARQVEEALTEDTEHVLNLAALEKLEQIEELTREVRKRLKRTY